MLARVDITDRKLAEAEARRMREELARVVRMTTLGQLDGHHRPRGEPAAHRHHGQCPGPAKFLQSATPNLEEIREMIVEDIIEDDQRASRVLQRLRSMLRRRESELVTI